jgi:hypothetical protein
MRSRYWVLLACLTFATLAACGDDDDAGDHTSKDDDDDDEQEEVGGNTTVDTGLTPTDTLASLTDADAQQVCMSTTHTLNTILPESKLREIGCRLFAIVAIVQKNSGKMTSTDVATCEKVTQDCVDGKPIDGEMIEVETEITDESGCDTASAEESFGNCEATVADYESCASKVASELRSHYLGITCDGLKDVAKFQESLEVQIDLSTAAECKELRTKCPDVELGGDSDTDTDDEG